MPDRGQDTVLSRVSRSGLEPSGLQPDVQDLLKTRKAPDTMVPLGNLLRAPESTPQKGGFTVGSSFRSPYERGLDGQVRSSALQLDEATLRGRLQAAFRPEGFEKWFEDMRQDPFSHGGKRLDGDRAIEIAAGDAPKRMIWEVAERDSKIMGGVSHHMVEAARKMNLEAFLAPRGEDRRYIVLGAPASGKTYTAGKLAVLPDTRFAASVGLLKAEDPIGFSLDVANAGNHSEKKPTIVFVFNPDLDQVAERYASREAVEERLVPTDSMAAEWREGPQKILNSAQKHEGKFELRLVNGSNGASYDGEGALENLREIVEQLKGLNHDDVRNAIQQGIEKHRREVPV